MAASGFMASSYFNVSTNRLNQSAIPAGWYSRTLRLLDIAYNDVSCPLPVEWGLPRAGHEAAYPSAFPSLERLALEGNNLSGPADPWPRGAANTFAPGFLCTGEPGNPLLEMAPASVAGDAEGSGSGSGGGLSAGAIAGIVVGAVAGLGALPSPGAGRGSLLWACAWGRCCRWSWLRGWLRCRCVSGRVVRRSGSWRPGRPPHWTPSPYLPACLPAALVAVLAAFVVKKRRAAAAAAGLPAKSKSTDGSSALEDVEGVKSGGAARRRDYDSAGLGSAYEGGGRGAVPGAAAAVGGAHEQASDLSSGALLAGGAASAYSRADSGRTFGSMLVDTDARRLPADWNTGEARLAGGQAGGRAGGRASGAGPSQAGRRVCAAGWLVQTPPFATCCLPACLSACLPVCLPVCWL